MQRVAEFKKVSKQQFSADFTVSFPHATEKTISEAYASVVLPERATKGSAGYDISIVCPITLASGQSIRIPTGLRVNIQDGWVLFLMPKSGLGTKYRLQLDNTIGVIDADYYQAKNEGHILIQITNDSKEDKVLHLDCGKSFVQGIFLPFGITQTDHASDERIGGFGSTGV